MNYKNIINKKDKILVVIGTRPEAIKMAPVIESLRMSNKIEAVVCVTAQHREMLDQVLNLYDIKPDFDLNLMTHGQDLSNLVAKIIEPVTDIIKFLRPKIVLVHGDTTTTLSAALAAYHTKTMVGHVEAGLRSHNMLSPWPEEANRRLTDSISSLHFAPTEGAKNNLINENIPTKNIIVTGNTVIDALISVKKKIYDNEKTLGDLKNDFDMLNNCNKTILVTSHRRENFGEGITELCSSLSRIVEKNKDLQVIFPVHLNSAISEPVNRICGNTERIYLLPPQDYLRFTYLMDNCDLIFTDSGGIQEEAISLKKTVFLLRENTERPEALTTGLVNFRDLL